MKGRDGGGKGGVLVFPYVSVPVCDLGMGDLIRMEILTWVTSDSRRRER